MTNNTDPSPSEKTFEERLAEEKRRADAETANMLNGQPHQSQANPASPAKQPLNLSSNFSIKSATRFALWTGGIGLAGYLTYALFHPAKNLFMVGPRNLAENLQKQGLSRFKSTASAIALATAQVLGAGTAGTAAYNYAVDATSFKNSNATMITRLGIAGFALNQLGLSARAVKNGHTKSFFEAMIYNTINSTTYLFREVGNSLADLTTSSISSTPGSRPTEVKAKAEAKKSAEVKQDVKVQSQKAENTRYIQICGPIHYSRNGDRIAPPYDNIQDGAIAAHFNAVNNHANEMKSDSAGALRKALKDKNQHIQLVLPSYNAAAKGINVKTFSNTSGMVCEKGYASVLYSAPEWAERLGAYPANLPILR